MPPVQRLLQQFGCRFSSPGQQHRASVELVIGLLVSARQLHLDQDLPSSVVVRQVPMIEQWRLLLISHMRRRRLSRKASSNSGLLGGEELPRKDTERRARGRGSSIAMSRYIRWNITCRV